MVSGWFLLVSGFWFSWFSGAAGNRIDGLLCRTVSDVDVAFFAAEVDAPETSEGTDLEDVDVGCLLRLVRRDGGVAGRRDFHDVQRLRGVDHLAVARPVDELRTVGGAVAESLAGGDLGCDAGCRL